MLQYSHLLPWGFLLHYPLSSSIQGQPSRVRPYGQAKTFGTSDFERLPTELLLQTETNLDDVTSVCLKNNTWRFRVLSILDLFWFSSCKNRAIEFRHRQVNPSQINIWPKMLTCISCESRYPATQREDEDLGHRKTISPPNAWHRRIHLDLKYRCCVEHPLYVYPRRGTL